MNDYVKLNTSNLSVYTSRWKVQTEHPVQAPNTLFRRTVYMPIALMYTMLIIPVFYAIKGSYCKNTYGNMAINAGWHRSSKRINLHQISANVCIACKNYPV